MFKLVLISIATILFLPKDISSAAVGYSEEDEGDESLVNIGQLLKERRHAPLEEEDSYMSRKLSPDELRAAIIANLAEELSDKGSITWEGGGTHKYGRVKINGNAEIWSDKDNKVDGRGYVQHSWSRGNGGHQDYGLGGTVSHNIYRDEQHHNELDAYAGFDRNWSPGHPSNHYDAGIKYNF